MIFPSGSRSTCSPLCFISHRGADRETFLILCLRRLDQHPDELLHSQTTTSLRTWPVLLRHRDDDVELALDVVRDTIPAAELLDYISAEALQAWTPPGITATDLRRYCLNYFSGSYNATASRRGVLVQKVDGNEDMATHYLFVLSKRDADVPKFDAEYRSRFNELRRLVSGLWGGATGPS